MKNSEDKEREKTVKTHRERKDREIKDTARKDRVKTERE